MLAPIQREVGRRWIYGDYSISEEHAATAAMETLVASLAGFFDLPEDGTPVTVACVEGETHSLPGRMITAHLLFLGWRATFLGANVPADDLETYLQQASPRALVLSCSLSANLRGARASIAAAHRAGVPVLAGGRGFGDDDRRAHRLGADGWAADARDVDDILGGWEPDIEAAERAVAATPPDLEFLSARRLQIVSHAAEHLRVSGDPLTSAALGRRNWEDVMLLFDVLTGALTAADPGVLAEFVRWHAEWTDWSDGPGDLTASLFAALRESVTGRAPEAVDYLDRALAELG